MHDSSHCSAVCTHELAVASPNHCSSARCVSGGHARVQTSYCEVPQSAAADVTGLLLHANLAQSRYSIVHTPLLLQEAEGADKQTLRLWLVGAASRLPNVDSSRVWRRLACLLPAGGHCSKLSKTCSLQLLQLVCDANPAKVTNASHELSICITLCWQSLLHNAADSGLTIYRLDIFCAQTPRLCATSFKVCYRQRSCAITLRKPPSSVMHGATLCWCMQITLSTLVLGFRAHMSGASRSSRMEQRLLHSMRCCTEQRWAFDRECLLTATPTVV